jgi:hypothetical protein
LWSSCALTTHYVNYFSLLPTRQISTERRVRVVCTPLLRLCEVLGWNLARKPANIRSPSQQMLG